MHKHDLRPVAHSLAFADGGRRRRRRRRVLAAVTTLTLVTMLLDLVVGRWTGSLALGSVVLMGVALWLAWEGVGTLRHPRPVDFTQALVVAFGGLLVNIASVWLLSLGRDTHDEGSPGHGPAHDHGHRHDHATHHRHDHGFSAACIHAIADAVTSLLAIAALADYRQRLDAVAPWRRCATSGSRCTAAPVPVAD